MFGAVAMVKLKRCKQGFSNGSTCTSTQHTRDTALAVLKYVYEEGKATETNKTLPHRPDKQDMYVQECHPTQQLSVLAKHYPTVGFYYYPSLDNGGGKQPQGMILLLASCTELLTHHLNYPLR